MIPGGKKRRIAAEITEMVNDIVKKISFTFFRIDIRSFSLFLLF